MINFFKYNNISSKDFGLYITDYEVYSAPAKKSTVETVPGRDGNLIIEDEQGIFANKKVVYTVAFSVLLANGKIERNIIKKIKEWLYSTLGYGILEDSYNPAYYRQAAIYEELNIESLIVGAVDEIKITFDCKPYMYAKIYPTFDLKANSTTEIYNPYKFKALPIIVLPPGNSEGIYGTLRINGKIFSLFLGDGNAMVIDSKKRTITEISTGVERPTSHMINEKGDFPILNSGRNLIIWENKLERNLKINTCWRCL